MAKVFRAPDHIKDTTDFRASGQSWQASLQKYDDDLKEYCLKHGEGKYRGKIISTHVCDGSARYMIFGTKGGVKLIHINTMDGYRAEPAWERGITLGEIKARLTLDEKLAKLFGEQS